jgi:hypothetical protein
MIKFRLGKLFVYNSELDAIALFNNRIEIWWRRYSWYRPREWFFDYNRNHCDCYLFEIGFFGISFLGKDCQGKYVGL